MHTLTETVHQIEQAVKIAEITPIYPEKKLRELVSPIWQNFLKEKRVGLNLQIRDELILANGKPDTVFNKLILEYKKPHVIKTDNDKNRKLIAQVQGYILDLAKAEHFSKERVLGVAFDGDYFLFMRYVGRWINEEPIPLSESSLDFFLKNLEKLTSKAALIPENLIRDFAVGKESRNKVAVDCIKAFYNEINQHGNETDIKEHFFFEQWREQFAEVHGSLEQKKIDTKTLFTSYGFSKREQQDFNVNAFFFALDSYYALLMKLLSYQVVGFYTLHDLIGLPLHDWENLSSDELRRKCDELEDGGFFHSIGIRNFLEGDLFSWYVQAWNENIYQSIQQIVGHLNDYDPETMELVPDETRDILKKLYQNLVPQKIRHDLGEYYTPDWLAERCLNQLNYNGDPKLRILDPGWGSGTFPILAIKRAKEYAKKNKLNPSETLKKILFNIQGFDLNPIAVISARTNYMLAIADLLKYKTGEITIPIYLCDSIKPPEARIAHDMTLFPEKIPYEVKTAVGDFFFSHSIISKSRIQQLANLMEDSVKAMHSSEDFLKRVEEELNLTQGEFRESELYLIEAYENLVELEHKGINGVWARIIKNAFAPLFVGQFDLVVGNPPWVNWISLPNEYRKIIKPIWANYDLFEHKGLDARLGKACDDISILMTYVAIDKYLKDKGKLCFVITQTLFKTAGGGEGFRRFRLGRRGIPFKVLQVDDMVNLEPFKNAKNRTSVLLCHKGYETTYPVDYSLWSKKIKGTIAEDSEWKEVQARVSQRFLKAFPISGLQSAWFTTKMRDISQLKNVLGMSYYSARVGSHTGGGNGIYWVKISGKSENGLLKIENLFDVGTKKYQPASRYIEKECLYPLLRGRDVNKWYARSSALIILPQNTTEMNKALSESALKAKHPYTLDYFKIFESELRKRSHYKKHFEPQRAPFYSMYNVGSYTFAPYKAVWKEQANGIQCALVSTDIVEDEEKIIIPDHKLMLVPFGKRVEAHFVVSCLNCSISRFIVMAYSISTQQSTHILQNIAIPKFNPSNQIHRELSHLSQQCHKKAEIGIPVSDLEEQIDELSAKMWGLTPDELQDIKDSLKELQ